MVLNVAKVRMIVCVAGNSVVSKRFSEGNSLGAGRSRDHRRLFSIFMTVSMPAIALVSIFNFISVWNNLLIPLVFINKASMKTIAISAPVVAYILLQEKVERGLISGALKG